MEKTFQIIENPNFRDIFEHFRHFSLEWILPKHLALPRTTPYGPLTLCQISEKTDASCKSQRLRVGYQSDRRLLHRYQHAKKHAQFI